MKEIIKEICPVCGEDLHEIVTTTNPPIALKKCFKCGWEYKYDEFVYTRSAFSPENPKNPCGGCSNNPRNGGSGVCHCILGSTVVY